MKALSALDRRVMEALCALAVRGAWATLDQRRRWSDLRVRVGCSAADLRDSVRRLRFKGIIAFDRLEPAPSTLPVRGAPAIAPPTEPVGPGAGAANAQERAAPASLAEQVGAEAEAAGKRRRQAQCTGTEKRPLDLSVAEKAGSLLVEEPHDAVALVARKWPETWRRVILLGRSLGLSPGVALFRAIEAGCDELAPEAAHG